MATLVSAYQKEGRYAVDLQASNLATGIYFYRLQAGDYNETRRCVVIK
jgi:5-hydroxyisourate hydrolase-like protein (transthyretin family)